MRNMVFQTQKSEFGLPVSAWVYTHIFVHIHVHNLPFLKKFEISCYIISFNQMSAFSSNDLITKFYEMDHCHSTSEI